MSAVGWRVRARVTYTYGVFTVVIIHFEVFRSMLIDKSTRFLPSHAVVAG
jgi:hypothetical protein